MSGRKYDVFISYRREGGINSAVGLHATLTQMHYRAFLDVNNLRFGQYDKALFDVIENCTDFLLVLSPNALDRCSDPDDWVRLEVEHAIAHNKHIIPIICDGADMKERFLDAIPPEMDYLRYYNVLEANIVQYKAMGVLLKNALLSKPVSTLRKKLLIAFGALLAVATLAGSSLWITNTLDKRAQDRELANKMMDTQMANFSVYNAAHTDYLRAVDAFLDDFNDLSNVLSPDYEQMAQDLDTQAQAMEAALKEIEELNPIDKGRIQTSRMNTEYLNDFPALLHEKMQKEINNLYVLSHNCSNLAREGGITSETLSLLQCFSALAALEKDEVLIHFDAIFLHTDKELRSSIHQGLSYYRDQDATETLDFTTLTDEKAIAAYRSFSTAQKEAQYEMLCRSLASIETSQDDSWVSEAAQDDSSAQQETNLTGAGWGALSVRKKALEEQRAERENQYLQMVREKRQMTRTASDTAQQNSSYASLQSMKNEFQAEIADDDYKFELETVSVPDISYEEQYQLLVEQILIEKRLGMTLDAINAEISKVGDDVSTAIQNSTIVLQ